MPSLPKQLARIVRLVILTAQTRCFDKLSMTFNKEQCQT